MTDSTKRPGRSKHEAKIRWLLENQSLLEDSFPGQRVAVNDQGVVAADARLWRSSGGSDRSWCP